MASKTRKRTWIISVSKRSKGNYIQIGYQKLDGVGYETRFAIGFEKDFEKYQENAIEKIKMLIKDMPLTYTKEKILDVINKKLKNNKTDLIKYSEIYKGLNLIGLLIDHFDIFKDCNKTKSISLNEVVKQQIYHRIKQPLSVWATFNSLKKEQENVYSKNAFYRSLDYIAENREQILQNLNDVLVKEHKRNVNIVWYDSTTTYFETFDRKGYKKPGYSKDGKFKEDQIVIGMATDSNGIPIHYKVFPGNTADSNTFIKFVLELQKIYKINNVTIVADKGMSVNKNIRFLEDKGLNFIISYRMKTGSRQFKEYVLKQEDYVHSDAGLVYKTQEFASLYRNGRSNGKLRKRIITFSKKRAKKDAEDRRILVENFLKKAKNGKVSYEDMAGNKKYKFFKPVNESGYYELDTEKIEQDEKFDGYYVYETNRQDLTPDQLVDLYAKQWKIEDNFRSLKGSLAIRAIYLSTWKHIEGYICLCFLSLVLLKFLVFKINDLTGLSGKDKFTEGRLIDMMNNVKEIQEKFNNQITKTFEINDDNLSQNWDDYHLVEKVFELTKIKK
ncbi:IS1634 family transposase [Mycoplasma sp. 744]|nr:IS1634 family transposase [Mycoplasma sp. 744]MEA4115454.1 IS1634 family transposase [Mycoplasma sp. 744]